MRPDVTDLLGTPFLDGGRDPRIGLDCWGLVRVVFARAGVDLPDYPISCGDVQGIGATVEDQRPEWTPITPGEIVPALITIRFNTIKIVNHTAVHLGGVQMIHTDSKKGVHMDRIDGPWWRRHIEGFYFPAREVALWRK